MPYRLQKRISMQNVPNFTLYLVALNILWASLIPQSTILFFEMLQRTQQKETLMIAAQLEIVFHLKIKWRLMRSGSSYVILAIRLALYCSQFSWAINWGKVLSPKKLRCQLLISSVLFTILYVICAIQIMSATQAETFINALHAEHRNLAIGRHILEAHGNNNLLKESPLRV